MLDVSHVSTYLRNNNIEASDNEVLIIYKFIKNNYNDLIDNEDTVLLLKNKLNPILFNKIYYLYKEKRTKYLS